MKLASHNWLLPSGCSSVMFANLILLTLNIRIVTFIFITSILGFQGILRNNTSISLL